MIKSFADAQTRRFWETDKPEKWPPANLRGAIKRKLAMLDGASRLEDLRALPGNRLHALVGHRTGQYSIRINHQFRICFGWRDGNAYDVEITDYH